LKEKLSGNEALSFYENWTNKVELAINNKDFPLALSALQEITESIFVAGYFEEYFRVATLLFNKIDFEKTYSNETPYLVSQIISYVELSSEINQKESARKVLESFRSIINNKSKDYVIYCKLECSFHWHSLDNKEAVKWGEKAVQLVKTSKADIDYDLEHGLNLAKRDTRDKVSVNEALNFFLKGQKVEDIIDLKIDENLSAQYFGNLGRCYFFLKEYDIALSLYSKAFKLSYVEEIASKYMNRGYVSYWIGQLLEKKGENKTSYFFYSNCMFYWKKHSPHRAQRVEDEIKVLKREIPDIDDLLKLDNETIENQCKKYNEKQLQLT
jgi:tetratricopeptide (TPR) repeat protein